MSSPVSPFHARWRNHLRARPRLLGTLVLGATVGALAPGPAGPVARGLLGWNAAVWCYVGSVLWMMWHADHARLRRVALAQAEGAATVLTMVIVACVVSLLGIVVELTAAKVPGAHHALPHLALALATVTGGWLLLPTVFTLNYASLYYRGSPGEGLQFPGADAHFKPDYADFLYFAFTIAVAAQTADVSISSAAMRRLVLVQAVLSFAFNTAILAFTINIAASMF